MTHPVTFACGNCGWAAWYSIFPPTNSWCVIIPCWLLALSALRTVYAPVSPQELPRLRGVPSFVIAAPLVVLIALIAPAILGPALGIWMPVGCVVATWSGLARTPASSLRSSLLMTTSTVVLLLAGFGTRDYLVYNQMTPEEKVKYLPCWRQPKFLKTAVDRRAAADSLGKANNSPDWSSGDCRHCCPTVS